MEEAQEILNAYYEENPQSDKEERTEEADKVAARIAGILSEKAFSFTPNEYISIHKKLFAGIYDHTGKKWLFLWPDMGKGNIVLNDIKMLWLYSHLSELEMERNENGALM